MKNIKCTMDVIKNRNFVRSWLTDILLLHSHYIYDESADSIYSGEISSDNNDNECDDESSCSENTHGSDSIDKSKVDIEIDCNNAGGNYTSDASDSGDSSDSSDSSDIRDTSDTSTKSDTDHNEEDTDPTKWWFKFFNDNCSKDEITQIFAILLQTMNQLNVDFEDDILTFFLSSSDINKVQ